MKENLHPITLALETMDAWLELPWHVYTAAVYRFANKLSPDEVLEAVAIAQGKVPNGGQDGFRYFCGVCHGMLRDKQIRLSWN